MNWKKRIDRLWETFGVSKQREICPDCGGSRCGSGRVKVVFADPELFGPGSQLCGTCGMPVDGTGAASIRNPGEELTVVTVSFKETPGVWGAPA